jgi:hypothetical protein
MGRRSILRSVLGSLPGPLRHWLLRRNISMGVDQIPESLEIKVATTQEELQAAYEILYESYLEYGYQEPNPERMRIIKYFALPTTTTVVAKVSGRVVGTVTFIRKSPMGLPMEKVFDLQGYVQKGETVVEVSSLAISSAYRHQRGRIFFPICNYIYHYLRRYLSADFVAIAVNPAWADFYEGYLLFSKIENRVIDTYNFANGAPAVGLIADVRNWNQRFEKIYNHLKPDQNFYQFIQKTDLPCWKWPERTFEKAMDPVLTPEMMKHFFFEKSKMFRQLSEFEYEVIRSSYTSTKFQTLLPSTSLLYRNSPRFTVNLMAKTATNQELRVQDVSWEGLKVQGLAILERFVDLEVAIAAGRVSRIKGEVVWSETDSLSAGLKLVFSDENWYDYLNYLRGDLLKIA